MSEGFQALDSQIKGSRLEEVTDDAGQRKFARWWFRVAVRNFSSLSASGPVDRDGRLRRRGELLFPRFTSATEK